MIISFTCKATERFFKEGIVGKGVGWSKEKVVVARKLDMLNAAVQVKDLRSPPGNMLEELNGKLNGYHSIRINDKWRIIFVWKCIHAEKVAVVDYH